LLLRKSIPNIFEKNQAPSITELFLKVSNTRSKPKIFRKMTSSIRASYSVSQKLKAIELVQSIGVCAAARQLSISKSSLSRWVSQKSEYLSVKSSKLHRRKLGSGRIPMFASEESHLYDHIDHYSVVAFKSDIF
jgi:transposase-like protein